jgi:hypothetical protein
MFKEVMNDLWLVRISSLSNEVGLYVVLLEVLLFMPNSLIRHLESLSDWVRTIRSLVQGRIHKLKNCVNSQPKSVFKDQEAVKCLSSLLDKYVILPANRWVLLKRRVGAVTSQRVLKVLFYVNILQCFFVVENVTAN